MLTFPIVEPSDYGNFCIAEDGYGSITDENCSEIYDIYKGVEEMMPKAMALSAKSFDFNAEVMKLILIIPDASIAINTIISFIGVEYEVMTYLKLKEL